MRYITIHDDRIPSVLKELAFPLPDDLTDAATEKNLMEALQIVDHMIVDGAQED